MMVSCPGCNTSYSIDERKLPPGGGKLTCRECGHAWKVGGTPASPAAGRRPEKPGSPSPVRPAAAAAIGPSHSDSSGTLQKPVNCPKCGHYFVPYQTGAPPAVSQAAPAGSAPARRKVLLVEDQEYFAELTSDALGDAYETTVATTPSSARHLVESGDYDLVILDLSLDDGQDGAQVLQATRRRAIPVLIFTARDETELYGTVWEQLRAAGASDILLKGLNVGDELRKKVQSILGGPRK